MSWTKKKVFVTGAGGFIGSHLCEKLVSAGADVTALVRYNGRNDEGNLTFLDRPVRNSLKVIQGNVEDSHMMAGTITGFDYLFHLAALIPIPYSYIAPLSFLRTNAEGTLNVLQAVKNGGAGKLVHTSSSEVYGTALFTPINESHPLQAQSPYSASKIAGDKLVESFYLSFSVPTVTVRPFNTYGPRQSARAVIPTIISQALSEAEIRLGALDPVRDLTFVSDTVHGFMQAAQCDQLIGKTVNLGCGKGISVGELAEKIQRLVGVNKQIQCSEERIRPPQSEVYKLICDQTLAVESFGWSPQVDLEEGLKRSIEFIAAHQQLFRSEMYVV